MTDRISTERRSENMRRIRGKDTMPELKVRRHLHARGLRFRLHRKDLPGKPDVVFPSRKVCVMVHGCFWHGCNRCIDGLRKVKSNQSFWRDKVTANKARDARNRAALEKQGWAVFTIWACETESADKLDSLVEQIRNRDAQPG